MLDRKADMHGRTKPNKERKGVKGGRKLRRVVGLSNTAALPEDFCENALFLAAVGAAAGKAFSAERKGSVQRYGTMASDSTKGITRRGQQTADLA